MSTVPHPEVLSPEFVPPTLFGRERELEQLRRLLTSPPDEPVGPRCALVRGPSGSGTSSLVRVAARRLSEEVRRTQSSEPPLVVLLRVPACRGTHGLAAELVRRLDDGFEPRGFHTMEMLAGFLRRLNRQARPAIVVLDDVGPAARTWFPSFEPSLAPTGSFRKGRSSPYRPGSCSRAGTRRSASGRTRHAWAWGRNDGSTSNRIPGPISRASSATGRSVPSGTRRSAGFPREWSTGRSATEPAPSARCNCSGASCSGRAPGDRGASHWTRRSIASRCRAPPVGRSRSDARGPPRGGRDASGRGDPLRPFGRPTVAPDHDPLA